MWSWVCETLGVEASALTGDTISRAKRVANTSEEIVFIRPLLAESASKFASSIGRDRRSTGFGIFRGHRYHHRAAAGSTSMDPPYGLRRDKEGYIVEGVMKICFDSRSFTFRYWRTIADSAVQVHGNDR